MPEQVMDNGFMSDSLRSNLSQLFEEATKSFEHHQILMNDARMTIDACRAALEHLEKDQSEPSQIYSTKSTITNLFN